MAVGALARSTAQRTLSVGRLEGVGAAPSVNVSTGLRGAAAAWISRRSVPALSAASSRPASVFRSPPAHDCTPKAAAWTRANAAGACSATTSSPAGDLRLTAGEPVIADKPPSGPAGFLNARTATSPCACGTAQPCDAVGRRGGAVRAPAAVWQQTGLRNPRAFPGAGRGRVHLGSTPEHGPFTASGRGDVDLPAVPSILVCSRSPRTLAPPQC